MYQNNNHCLSNLGDISSDEDYAPSTKNGKESMFPQNPLQKGCGEEKDLEMGKTPTAKKRKTKRIATAVTILNDSTKKSATKVIDARDLQDHAARVLSILEKARKVKGLDGADSIFNQAVVASRELHHVSILRE